MRPQNVFLSDKGKVKIANPLSWPDEPNSHGKIHEGHVAYLPPEEIESLRKGQRNLAPIS